MTLLILALLIVIPFIPAGYALPKLLVLACGGFLLKGRTRSSANLALIFGWYVLLMTTLYSVDPFISIVGRYNDWAHGLLGWGILTVFFLLGAQGELTLKPLAYTTAGLSALCVVQRLFMPRSTGTIGDPVGMGALLALMAPAVAHVDKRLLLLIVPGVIATGSRGAMIGVAVGLAIYASQER